MTQGRTYSINGETRNTHIIMVAIPEENTWEPNYRSRWEDDSKMKDMQFEGVEWIKVP
jgi:hypothetical protein